MESQVKFQWSHINSGASKQNIIAAKPPRKLLHSATTSDGPCANSFSLAATLKILTLNFSNQFGISRLPEKLITPDQLYGPLNV